MADSPMAGFDDYAVFAASSPQVVKRAKELDGSSFIDVEPTTGKREKGREGGREGGAE